MLMEGDFNHRGMMYAREYMPETYVVWPQIELPRIKPGLNKINGKNNNTSLFQGSYLQKILTFLKYL